MKYFEKFPLIWHTLDDGDQVMLQNITRRVMTLDKIKDIEGVLLDYQISDGETPRQFAQRVYGSYELYWVSLLVNKYKDPIADWPKPEQRVIDELIEQYGEDGMWETRHYVNEFGIETDPRALRIAYGLVGYTDDTIIGDYGLTPVNYHDYEISINEAKRNIKILHPDNITQFVSQFQRELLS